MLKRIIPAVVLVVAGMGAGAQAQSTRVPAENPPADYTASQYVDSNGCVFVRAGFNGTVTWVPRYGDDRQPMCGFIPSLGGGGAQTQIAEAPGAQPAPPPVTVGAPEVGATGLHLRTASSVVPETVPPPREPVVRTRASAPAPRLREIPTQQVYLSDTPGYDSDRRQSRSFGRAFCGLNPCVSGDMPGLMHGANATAPAARFPRPSAPSGATQIASAQPAQGSGGGGRLTAGQYVQVGVYGSAANATAAIADLQSSGLPVAMARGVSGGSEYRVILAGPFADAGQREAALRRARAMGYADAFIR